MAEYGQVPLKYKTMYLECTCADISQRKWDKLMKGAKPLDYKWLVSKIKREIPDLYRSLSLDLHNPWCEDCYVTDTHYILTWSATEYFIRKG